MKVFALTVLLAVMQAGPLAADDPASRSKNVSHNSDHQQTPTDAPSAIPEKSTRHVDQDSGKAPAETNAKETTVIREAAPVPKPGKDWWDKAYVIFTGLLVIVGGLAVGYAVKTLRAIERQALSMRYQTTHLRNSVIQARKAANAAKRSAEFAELATKASECADVLLDGVSVVVGASQQLDGQACVRFRFRNFGRTRANNTKFDCRLMLPNVPDDPGPMLIPVVMGAGDSQDVSFQRFIEWLNKPTFDAFLRGEIKLRFNANINFEDVFGQSHSASYAGIFDSRSRLFRVE
jgi:hypothetical protein